MNQWISLQGPNHAVAIFGFRLVGVNAENGWKVLLSLAFLTILFLVSRALRGLTQWALGDRRDKRLGFWTKQGIHLTTAVVLILGLLSIWFDDPTRLATAIGLVTAGLAVAVARYLSCLSSSKGTCRCRCPCPCLFSTPPLKNSVILSEESRALPAYAVEGPAVAFAFAVAPAPALAPALPPSATVPTMPTPWLSPRDLLQQAPIRLFCLPHAGSGAATYYRWKRLISSQIDICPILLPGREMRLAEPSLKDPTTLTEALLEATSPYLQTPYAIFGHSMGALLAYSWAQRIQRQNLPLPTCLFVSGRNAAHLPFGHRNLHLLSDADLIAELRRRYGASAGSEDLLADPELSQVFLPILRADLTLVETYRHTPNPPLTSPIVALAGEDDPSVSNEGLAAWATLTSGRFTAHRLPGDHFYQTGEGQAALLDLLTTRLNSSSQR